MSYSIEFIKYQEVKSGTALHTITEFELKIDPKSIAGVDYHKQESRLCRVSAFADSWLDSYLRPFINTISGRIGNYPFWEIAIRLKYNGAVEYTGYLRNDAVDYNKKTNIYTMTFSDTLSILNHIGDVNNIDTNTEMTALTFQLKPALINILDRIISETGITLNVAVTDDYNLGLDSAVSNVTLYDKNNDDQLIELLDEDPIEDFIWVTPLTETFTEAMLSDYTWHVRHNYIYLEEYFGAVKCIWSRYRQKGLGYENYGGNVVAKVQEELLIKEMVIDNDILIVSQNLIFKDDISHAATATMLNYLNDDEDNMFKYEYIDQGYLQGDVYEYTIGNDAYTVSTNGNFMYYNGILDMTSIRWDYGIFTLNSILKLLLTISNLTLVVEDNGDLTIRNKGSNTGGRVLTIADADVVDFVQSGILRSDLNLGSIVRVASKILQPPLAEVLNQYYNNLYTGLLNSTNLTIVNNYNLSVYDVITVYGETYKIISVHLDTDRFIYTIRAWRV